LLGEFSDSILEDNRDRWSGDHCIAAHLVPGILLANRPILVDAAETPQAPVVRGKKGAPAAPVDAVDFGLPEPKTSGGDDEQFPGIQFD